MAIEKKLSELGLSLPDAPAAAGNYVSYVCTGRLVYISGTICMVDGKMTHTGKIGRGQTVESGYNAAQICALNALTNIKQAVGSLDLVKQIVFVGGYVNAVEGFSESSAVINGASDLFVKLFGDAGKHARAAVAVAGLPKDSTVEIQCVVEVA